MSDVNKDRVFASFQPPHSNLQRLQFWYLYGEWRELLESKLVVEPGAPQQPSQIVVRALNEVIDCHPIEHVFRMRGERPGFLVKWAIEIPRWLFEAVQRFNRAEAERLEKERAESESKSNGEQ